MRPRAHRTRARGARRGHAGEWAAALAVSAAVAAVLAMLAHALSSVGAPARAEAQAAGRISGEVRSGTAGATLDGSLRLLLITLEEAKVVGSQEATPRDGRFAFDVDPRRGLSHVLRATYQGVPYFAEVVRLTPEQPRAERALTVYETTRERPALRIESTAVTVIAIDRGAGELTLLREDLVQNPGDRVYLGDDRGATIRVPAPDATREAGGLEGSEDELRHEGGVVVASTPLRPGLTSVVTRYLVGYDLARDRYRLRVTAPWPTDRIEARVPARFVLSLSPVQPTRRDRETDLQGERLLVVSREPAAEGQGLLVDLDGLSGVLRARQPLTERPASAVAAAVALAAVAGGAIAIGRLTRARSR